MEIGRIAGSTRTLGKAQGYYGLPIRDDIEADTNLADSFINDTVTGPGTPVMRTAWFPTPDELAAINAGAPVVLTVVGIHHPPVMLTTGEVPA